MAKRRKYKISDPAEIARQRAEREKYTRRTPSEWGLNHDALSLPQNAGVAITEPTREKVSRVVRYDCFVTLKIEVAAYMAVRRYQEVLALIHGCDGSDHMGEKVDGGGSRELLSARWIEASNIMAALHAAMLPWQADLLEKLSLPAVVEGREVNWQAITLKATGLIDRDARARAVKQAAEAVRRAWQEYDSGTMRRAA